MNYFFSSLNKSMLLSGLIFFAIIYIAGCSNAHSADTLKDGKGKRRSVQMLDSVITFNNLREGDKIAVHYRFKNTGTRPLMIKDVITDCGCTIAEKPEYAIAVNAIDSIKVRFNSNGKVGEVYKEITIQTDDPGRSFITVYLQGKVTSRY